MKKNKWTIILIIAGLLGVFALLPSGVTNQLGNLFGGGSQKTEVVIDTTVIINDYKSKFKNQLKAHLIDSLESEIKPEVIVKWKEQNIDSLIKEAINYWADKTETDSTDQLDQSDKEWLLKSENDSEELRKLKLKGLNKYLFTSIIDTTVTVKDSSNRVTDYVEISSTVISPIPIHQQTIHSISVRHERFEFHERLQAAEYTIFEDIKFAGTVAAGYGMINKNFDVFVGFGIVYQFDPMSFF